MLSILWNSNTGWVLLSTMILGIAAGTIGCMAYWKKQNLMSDALSHAALPGIVLAFLIVGEKICLHLSLVLRLVHCLVHFYSMDYNFKQNLRRFSDGYGAGNLLWLRCNAADSS